jgi:hypothetical protein
LRRLLNTIAVSVGQPGGRFFTTVKNPVQQPNNSGTGQ